MDDMIYVVQWDDGSGTDIADSLRAAGWPVEVGQGSVEEICDHVSNCLPLAVLIPVGADLEEGCNLACRLMANGATARTPIVFVGGIPESEDIAKELVPSAEVVAAEDLAGILARLKGRK